MHFVQLSDTIFWTELEFRNVDEHAGAMEVVVAAEKVVRNPCERAAVDGREDMKQRNCRNKAQNTEHEIVVEHWVLAKARKISAFRQRVRCSHELSRIERQAATFVDACSAFPLGFPNPFVLQGTRGW